MRNRGPTPSVLLAQLAENVTRQIQTGSHVRFDAALDELTEYHRFLLEAYATVAEDGETESYARMNVSWRSPHQDWQSAYFDIFDAALKRLHDDSHFISALSYLTARLMPRGNEYGAPQPGNDILDLMAILVYRLEAWRRSNTKKDGETEQFPEGFGPSTYDDILMSIVSAWEHTLRYASALQEYENITDASACWTNFKSGASFLLRHLQISGEILLTAVWDHDGQAEARFRDMMLRWPATTGLRSYDRYSITWRPYPNTDLLAHDWPSALELVTRVVDSDVAPEAIFGAILENTHSHLSTIVAALMINWHLMKKTDIAAVQAAQRLLNRQMLEGDSLHIGRPRFEQNFRRVFFRLLEMHLSGQHDPSKAHGALLDNMAETLDRLSERRVQSGRGYTPSTIHNRSQLSIAFALILTASASGTDVAPILRNLEAYLSDEPGLPDGDHTVLEALQFLDSLEKGLDPIDEPRAAILQTLNPQIDLRAATNAVREITSTAKESITVLRTRRIRERAIDPEKIRHLETLAEKKLSTDRGDVPIFRNFTIRKLENDAITLDGLRYEDIPKNEFVTPPMGYASSNFFDVISSHISEQIAGRIWQSVRDFERTEIIIESSIAEIAFWERAEQLAGQVGPKPCLTISQRDFSAFAERFLYRHDEDVAVRVSRDRDRYATPQDRYVATVNGIDVHAIFGQDQQAWLFSAEALGELRYRILDNGLIVAANFVSDAGDPWQGHLDFKFGHRTIWRTKKLFELNFVAEPTPPEQRH